MLILLTILTRILVLIDYGPTPFSSSKKRRAIPDTRPSKPALTQLLGLTSIHPNTESMQLTSVRSPTGAIFWTFRFRVDGLKGFGLLWSLAEGIQGSAHCSPCSKKGYSEALEELNFGQRCHKLAQLGKDRLGFRV